jgi:hypothetical protein
MDYDPSLGYLTESYNCGTIESMSTTNHRTHHINLQIYHAQSTMIFILSTIYTTSIYFPKQNGGICNNILNRHLNLNIAYPTV